MSCRTEEITVTIDTSSWPRHCLGYHSFIAPPDLSLTSSSAQVGTEELSVVTTPAPVREFIEAQEDFGQALVIKQVNDWLVIVASENLGLTVSSRTVVVYGARRVGSQIALTRAGASKSRIAGGGNDPRLWAFHSRTNPLPLADRGGAEGFCYDGMFFAGPPPEGEASFSASLAELDLPDSRGVRRARSDNSLSLHFLVADEAEASDRQLAPQTDISTQPGVSVSSEKLRLMGGDVGLATTSFDDGKQEGHWYDAAYFGKAGSVSEPLVISIQYTNSRLDPADSRELMLGILSGLRVN